ncbi:FHA domain-containing protein FHA2 [Ananas comosus]|uniref:FHA domain-containing protein FHA2 n=1 Tax=Ananas comosus TaxID=4615 RepID=A0A199UU00_ANACO|nr:FHA domain-containing protein FHA2 [Ananas comosus]
MVKSRKTLGGGGGGGGGGGAAAATASDSEVGFAKLQGEDFEYYMQTYSIILGRNSKKSEVDVDLASLGGGMNISRHHARIFYDFARRRFALEVIGKNGCLVEGVLHVPGTPPVKLDSQDLLQMGDKQFYFLLPSRSIFDARPSPASLLLLLLPRPSPRPLRPRPRWSEHAEGSKPGPSGRLVKKSEKRSRADREADNNQLLQLEEKDVISSVATVLSDLCGPGEWMPMTRLHEVLLEKYGNIWHHSRVRKYLTSEDLPQNETKGRPWFGLLALLRKYPEHFVINTRTKGRLTQEFVSLVSLLS